MDKYLAEKENINKQVDKIRCDINEKRQSTFDITAECLKLKQQVAECAERNAVSETRTSYALSLYKKISGINWDYVDSPSKLSGSMIIIYYYYFFKLDHSFLFSMSMTPR